MIDQPVLPASEDIARSPTFSLGTALLWLGHDCPGSCPTAVTDVRAAVWFMHLPDHSVATWTRTLVDVDFKDRPWPDAERSELLRRVNHCVWADNLRVRERTAVERATFFAALVARRGGSSHPYLTSATLATNLPAPTNAKRREVTTPLG